MEKSLENRREYYIDQYKQLHKKSKYGTSSERQLVTPVQNLIEKIKPQSVLDYGCGQSRLYQLIRGPKIVDRYDPAIEEISSVPKDSYDLVICTDVMEHIPEEEIDNVLKELSTIGDKTYLVISCVAAYAKLPNGENAHTTVKPQWWWVDKLEQYWPKVSANLQREGYVSAVCSKS